MAGNKNAAAKNLKQVRSMDEINREYSELIGKVGQAQYTAYVYLDDVKKLNERILAVNQEAAKRRDLDQLAAKQQSGAGNVQSQQS